MITVRYYGTGNYDDSYPFYGGHRGDSHVWLGRLLLLLSCGAAMAACTGDKQDSTSTPEPCAQRECGTSSAGNLCGQCEASDVPFGARDSTESTFCNERSGQCGDLVQDCSDGWCVIPAGMFEAGWDRAATDPMFQPEPHQVRLSWDFRIQQTEVTQEQWLEVMASNPSPFPDCGAQCPVSGMTWFDVIEYANRLSKRDGLAPCYRLVGCDAPLRGDHWRVCDRAEFLGQSCLGYRLPTEMEWEHAARAGTATCYSDQELDYPTGVDSPCKLRPDVDANAWYCGNSDQDVADCVVVDTSGKCSGVHPVGMKRPNRFGLHEMYGNVQEFTTSAWRWPEDFGEFNQVRVNPGADPLIERSGVVTVRGGFYAFGAELTCAGRRGPIDTRVTANSDTRGFTGFRVVQTLPWNR